MIRCIIHCHSHFSPDSNLSVQSIVSECRARNIQAIALTDHNTMQGVAELQSLASPDLTVIPGEEISSAEGHIIGLYLQEAIPAGLPIQDTIKRIRYQNGIIIVPHPFDTVRRESVGETVLSQIRKQIDFLEIFNARCLRRRDNETALLYAKRHGLPAIVGPDAHFASEYGNAVCKLSRVPNRGNFIHILKTVEFTTRSAGWVAHLRSQGVKRIRGPLRQAI